MMRSLTAKRVLADFAHYEVMKQHLGQDLTLKPTPALHKDQLGSLNPKVKLDISNVEISSINFEPMRLGLREFSKTRC